jgi:type IV secretory pathway VirB4 component
VDEDENDLKIIELHLNIIVWAKDEDKLRHHKLQLEKNFKMLNIIPYQIKRDIQNNFIYNSPGATGYLAEAYRFINTSTHSPVFLNMESYNKGNKEGILLNDKGTGKTIRLDLWKAPLDRGLIKNRNRLILGAKEKGEAILINHILAQYNEQRHHIMMIDIDDSYQKICEESHGNHYCYDLEKPIPFNPFYCEDLENVPLEKKKFIRILINLIWEEKKSTSASDNDQLDQYITKYYDHIVLNDTIEPSLSSFYEYMSTLDDSKSTAPNFDRQSLLASIKPFYEGEYKNIFCTEAPYGVSNNSFAVFSLRSIKDNATLLPLITLLCIADFYDKAPENPSIKKSLFINECWKSLSNSQKPDTIKLLYNRPPKANTELVVMTKALKDVIADPMGKFIIDQTETLVFMKQKIQSSLKQDLARHLSFTESEVKKLFSIDDREVFIKVGGLSNIYVIEEILCRQSRFKIPINIANNYF